MLKMSLIGYILAAAAASRALLVWYVACHVEMLGVAVERVCRHPSWA